MRIQDASKIKILKCSLTREASNNRCYRRRRRRRWHHERRMLIIVNLHGRDTTPAAGLVRGEFFSWCATFGRRRRRCASFCFFSFFFKIILFTINTKILWLVVIKSVAWNMVQGSWTDGGIVVMGNFEWNLNEDLYEGHGQCGWASGRRGGASLGVFFYFYFKCLFCSGWSFDFHARLVVFTFISLGS